MRIRFCLLPLIMLIMLCACQKSPDNAIIVSKNDGAFDANMAMFDTEDHLPDATEALVHKETFFSTDKTVTFNLNIDTVMTDANMPIIEVIPHPLSEKDAHKVAQTIFGSEAQFYEAEPKLKAIYSKKEITEQIARWSVYSSPDMLKELLGERDEYELETYSTLIKEYIEYLTVEAYEQASHDYIREICQWEYRNSSFYFDHSLNNGQGFQKENEEIHAWTRVGEYFYTFEVSKRDESDFKLNNIYVYPNTTGPICLDYEICRAEKLRTEKPTYEQIIEVKNKAQQMLNAMELGSWLVDQAYVSVNDKGTAIEYSIYVDAVPVLNGIPAVRRPQLTNLKSEETFASNYYLTDAHFEFSAGGELVDFSLYSPIDVKQLIRQNVVTLSKEDLIQRVKQQLSMSDYYEFGFGSVVDSVQEDIACIVNILKADYGLTRVKVPDTDENYYYVPALTIYGTIEYIGKDTGEVYYQSNRYTDVLTAILTLNAVDGTVILGN